MNAPSGVSAASNQTNLSEKSRQKTREISCRLDKTPPRVLFYFVWTPVRRVGVAYSYCTTPKKNIRGRSAFPSPTLGEVGAVSAVSRTPHERRGDGLGAEGGGRAARVRDVPPRARSDALDHRDRARDARRSPRAAQRRRDGSSRRRRRRGGARGARDARSGRRRGRRRGGATGVQRRRRDRGRERERERERERGRARGGRSASPPRSASASPRSRSTRRRSRRAPSSPPSSPPSWSWSSSSSRGARVQATTPTTGHPAGATCGTFSAARTAVARDVLTCNQDNWEAGCLSHYSGGRDVRGRAGADERPRERRDGEVPEEPVRLQPAVSHRERRDVRGRHVRRAVEPGHGLGHRQLERHAGDQRVEVRDGDGRGRGGRGRRRGGRGRRGGRRRRKRRRRVRRGASDRRRRRRRDGGTENAVRYHRDYLPDGKIWENAPVVGPLVKFQRATYTACMLSESGCADLLGAPK